MARRRSRKPQARSEIQVMIGVFILLAVILSLLIELLLIPQLENYPNMEAVFSTISQSLITATFLAVTFELMLWSIRERAVAELLESHSSKVLEHIDSIKMFTAREIFMLLRDIARQTEQLPTLYDVPRRAVEGREYSFASSMRYFEKLIASRRFEVVNILREWIDDDSPNVRFLASDFIGYFMLCELREDVLRQASFKLVELEEKYAIEDGISFSHSTVVRSQRGPNQTNGQNDVVRPEITKGIARGDAWKLNYLWAASRCDDAIYESLSELLMSTKSPRIQSWVLFVPRQMPHERFFDIIASFLSYRLPTDGVAPEVLGDAIESLATLVRRGKEPTKSARKAIKKLPASVVDTALKARLQEVCEGLSSERKLKAFVRRWLWLGG